MAVWDIANALRKKQEHETARLLDFEFRLRARTARLIAEALGRDPAALVTRTVHEDRATLLAGLAAETGRDLAALDRLWRETEARARPGLVAELGDPTPVRLA